jgi:hypothetical protein
VDDVQRALALYLAQDDPDPRIVAAARRFTAHLHAGDLAQARVALLDMAAIHSEQGYDVFAEAL